MTKFGTRCLCFLMLVGACNGDSSGAQLRGSGAAQTEVNTTVTDTTTARDQSAVWQGMNHSQASILEYMGEVEQMSASSDFGVDVEFGTEIMNAWSVPPVCSDQYDMCLMMRQEIFRKDPTVYEELISIHRSPRSQTSDIYSENAESMARAISGKLGIAIKYKFFELSGLAEMKVRSSKNKKAISLDRTVRFVQKRVSLRKTSLSKYLTADARHALETWSPEMICERIGDFYATNLDLGGWYTRSVRVKVSKEQESLDIHGKLTASFDAVVTKISGEAELDFSEGSQKSSIMAVTYVKAAGGDPSSLNGQMGGDPLDSAAKKWADSIDLTKNPEAPLTTMNYRVRPLWEIVDEFDPAKGKMMRDYYTKKWEGNAQLMQEFENSFKDSVAALKLGARNSNLCHPGYYRIIDSVACQTAAATLGKSWGGVGSFPTSPPGCLTSEWDGRGVFHNSHPTGSPHKDQAPICQLEVPYLKYGARNSNTCPSGYSSITNSGACQTAAAALGKSWGGVGSFPTSPVGCLTSEWDGRGVYYNSHPTGRLHKDQAPICQLAH